LLAAHISSTTVFLLVWPLLLIQIFKDFLSRFEFVSRGLIWEWECLEAEEATVFCQKETWDTGDTVRKSDTSTKKRQRVTQVPLFPRPC